MPSTGASRPQLDVNETAFDRKPPAEDCGTQRPVTRRVVQYGREHRGMDLKVTDIPACCGSVYTAKISHPR